MSSMALMAVQDAAFLLPENREQPMHVGSLQLFDPPEGAGKDFMGELYQSMLQVDDIAPLFRRRAYRSLSTLGQWAWADDQDIDLEHHVRHSALPRPGRIRELLALTSRLHSTLLDRQRPLWEMHMIEGLEDGRVAVYTKIHHSLMDGVAGLRLLQRTLTTDPEDDSIRAPYMNREDERTRSHDGGGSTLGALQGLAMTAVNEVTSLAPMMVRGAEKLIREQAKALPSAAPRTILNGQITGSRRFAAQSWQLSRLKGVAKAAGVSLNDAVLGMCSGALRAYLDELDALPDQPLIANVPVSLMAMGIGSASAGNNVGSILANLATNERDPAKRLAKINESMIAGKERLAGMTALQISASAALAMAPVALSSFFGANRLLPPPFNLVISNVPGPREPLFMNGARLDAFYPLSIPTNGQALNITVTSYVDSMEFGLTGCRRDVPHLQRLLGHLETSLAELEQATR
jgi:WS/DGAT/MGAT family acyltransferase